MALMSSEPKREQYGEEVSPNGERENVCFGQFKENISFLLHYK
jgi:hypothetical protein